MAIASDQSLRKGIPFRVSLNAMAVILFRFVLLTSFMLWQGGFTFYGAVVIPAGHRVLGTHLEVGFITQDVTLWINVLGDISCALLLLNLLSFGHRQRRLTQGLLGTLLVIAVAQIVLHLLHPAMDALLDSKDHELLQRPAFDRLHRIYLLTATLQWVAAMVQLWLVICGWRETDRYPPFTFSTQPARRPDDETETQ
jgi:hypothetical protein